MRNAVADVLHYISERTLDLCEEDYSLFLEQLKDELSRLQFLEEWKEGEE